jgi:hypothetical protein
MNKPNKTMSDVGTYGQLIPHLLTAACVQLDAEDGYIKGLLSSQHQSGQVDLSGEFQLVPDNANNVNNNRVNLNDGEKSPQTGGRSTPGLTAALTHFAQLFEGLDEINQGSIADGNAARGGSIADALLGTATASVMITRDSKLNIN